MSVESKKPDLTIKGSNTVLSIWISSKGLRLSISKRVEKGFERIDSYTIPLEVILTKALFKQEMIESLKQFCLFVDRIAIEEEIEEGKE